ncbi:MAG: DUF2911 domain-containing protein [Bryobacteraceae bacterium]
MNKTLAIVSGLSLLLVSAAGLMLQAQDSKGGKKKERASPHEEAVASFGEKKITISYGRPYKKGRVIFGGLEPWGKVWRTGADEATTFTTTSDLMVGPLHVVAGSYSLFTIPNEKEWTLVLNKTVKQWGAFQYKEGDDYGRAPMKIAHGPVTEQLTIGIKKKNDHEGTLEIKWDESVATIDLMVH